MCKYILLRVKIQLFNKTLNPKSKIFFLSELKNSLSLLLILIFLKFCRNLIQSCSYI